MTMIASLPRPDEPDLPPGLRPVSTGARLGARLLDGVFGGIAVLGITWAVLEVQQFRAVSVLGVVGALVFVAWIVLGLWSILGRGARLAGLLLGQRWIVAADGTRPGGALLGKLFIQGGIGLVSLGLGEPVVSLITLRGSHNRNWFDRLTGLVLVQGVEQRGMDQTPASQPLLADDRPVNVHQVGLPEHRVPASPLGPPVPIPTHAGPRTPGAPPPITNVGVRQVNAEFIQSTPWSGEQVARPVVPPQPPRRPAVMRPRSTPATDRLTAAPREEPVPAEHTLLAPFGERGRVPWLCLDDGTRVDLATTVVFGREPSLPPDLGSATPVSLPDPSMRLSKTHVAIGVDPDGVWVLDLYSTNGVRVDRLDAGAAALPPGQPTPIPIGSRVEFGGRSLEVRGG